MGDLVRKTYVIVHICGTHEHSANVVCPLQPNRNGAVILDLCAIEDFVFIGEKRGGNHPSVGLICPVRISLIARIPGKPGRKLKEPRIGDAVFIIISFIEGEDLPS